MTKMETENQTLPKNTNLPTPSKIKKTPFIILLVLLILFFGLIISLFYQNYQLKKQINQLQVKPISTPTPSSSVIKRKGKPLVAYLKKYKLFLYNPNTGLIQEIAKGDSIKARWTKDGQWLYWYVKDNKDKKNSRFTFFKARFPDFQPEKFWEVERTYQIDDIYDFYPLQKTNQLLISQKDGVYLYADFQNLSSLFRKKLLTTKHLPSLPSNITNSYGILNLSRSEKYAILENRGWETILEGGVLNLDDGSYRIIPEATSTDLDTAVFSPNEQFLLIAGPVNAMGGGGGRGIIYRFPSLEIYKKTDQLLNEVIGDAAFLSDNLAVFSVNFLSFISDKTERTGLAIVDFVKGKEIKFIEYPLKAKKEDFFIPGYAIEASNNLVFFVDTKTSKIGFLLYDQENNEVLEKKVFDNHVDFSLPILPQPK